MGRLIELDVDKLKELLNENKIELTNNIISIVRENYIPKADYETRLKADMVSILDKIRAEIEKLQPNLRPEQMTDYDYAMVDVVDDIVAIIDKYKAEKEKE